MSKIFTRGWPITINDANELVLNGLFVEPPDPAEPNLVHVGYEAGVLWNAFLGLASLPVALFKNELVSGNGTGLGFVSERTPH